MNSCACLLDQKKYPCVWCCFGCSKTGVFVNGFTNCCASFEHNFFALQICQVLIMGVIRNISKGLVQGWGLAHLKNYNSPLKKLVVNLDNLNQIASARRINLFELDLKFDENAPTFVAPSSTYKIDQKKRALVKLFAISCCDQC